MAHVVTQPCYDCKYTDCVTVCPVECFYQDRMTLYIDPADCIDCEACVPECPVEAIYRDADVPSEWASYTDLNDRRSTAFKKLRVIPDALKKLDQGNRAAVKDIADTLRKDVQAVRAVGDPLAADLAEILGLEENLARALEEGNKEQIEALAASLTQVQAGRTSGEHITDRQEPRKGPSCKEKQ